MLFKRYCLYYKDEIEDTNNIASRKVTMTNKVVRDKSRCGECLYDQSRFLKQKSNKKVVSKYYKTNMLTYCLKCKRKAKSKDAKMIKIVD